MNSIQTQFLTKKLYCCSNKLCLNDEDRNLLIYIDNILEIIKYSYDGKILIINYNLNIFSINCFAPQVMLNIQIPEFKSLDDLRIISNTILLFQ